MQNKKLPLSVTICSLNEEKNISHCIESIIEQNPYEIILIDGSSNDRTVEIAQKYNTYMSSVGLIGDQLTVKSV